MKKEQISSDYIDYKKTSVKHKEKIKDIKRYIDAFLNISNKEFKDFDQKDLIKFMNYVSDKYSVGSQNTIKPIIKHFIKYFFEDYPTRFRKLDELCRIQKTPATYTADQMLKVEEVVKIANTEPTLFWKTWWLIFFYGGFRPSETAKMQFKHITFEKDGTATIKMFLTKNKRDVIKSIPEQIAECLKKWKEQIPHDAEDWVFPSPLKKGEHIHPKTGYLRIVKISKNVLGKHVNPYIVRHSFGSIKYNDPKIDKSVIAEQMGHNKNMEYIYKHLNYDEKVTNAKKIWSKESDLPPEKKHELEKQIKLFRTALLEYINGSHNLLKIKSGELKGKKKEDALVDYGNMIKKVEKLLTKGNLKEDANFIHQ